MSSASNENDSPDPLIHKECQMLSLGTLGYGLAPEGCLKYYVEPRLPFDDGTGRWADFLVEANGSASDLLAISLRGTETKASCRAALNSKNRDCGGLTLGCKLLPAVAPSASGHLRDTKNPPRGRG
jgi:hypothetical protein